MLYIICALKSEAQAFVDKYKLPKNKQNSKLTVIVSGMGSKNMFDATLRVVDAMNENDTIINVGICGADKKFFIGQLIDARKENLTCVDFEVWSCKFRSIQNVCVYTWISRIKHKYSIYMLSIYDRLIIYIYIYIYIYVFVFINYVLADL